MIPSASGLRYEISPGLKGWKWTVYGADGAARVRGEGPTRAVAAACVIRCISRAVTPADAVEALRAA